MSGNNFTNSIGGLSTLVRPKFGPGMLLQHDDLEQLSAYTRDLNRLMFRSLFGCGVVCGLIVKAATVCHQDGVTVTAGLALGCSGDPIYVPKDQSLPLHGDDCPAETKDHLWVVLCATTKCCAPRTAVCSPDDDETPSVCTRERDGWEIRIVSELRKCMCYCEIPQTIKPQEFPDNKCKCVEPDLLPCYKSHYDGDCACKGGEECDCSCECVVLAQLDHDEKENRWTVDHRIRRFIRPVLMRDPQVEIENEARKTQQKDSGSTPAPAALAEAEAQPAKSSRAAKSRQQQ
jgi:hypothetical protein